MLNWRRLILHWVTLHLILFCNFVTAVRLIASRSSQIIQRFAATKHGKYKSEKKLVEIQKNSIECKKDINTLQNSALHVAKFAIYTFLYFECSKDHFLLSWQFCLLYEKVSVNYELSHISFFWFDLIFWCVIRLIAYFLIKTLRLRFC